MLVLAPGPFTVAVAVAVAIKIVTASLCSSNWHRSQSLGRLIAYF
jgi:hypothetical protein